VFAALCVTMCGFCVNNIFYSFTSYLGLIIALHKCTYAAHKYLIFENWRIARRTFYLEIVSIIAIRLNRNDSREIAELNLQH